MLTGVWGMNFDHMPELQWEHGYTMFRVLAAMVFLVAVTLISHAHFMATRSSIKLIKAE